MRKQGFTIIELLVVIGVVAVLVGLLLPALAVARRNSQRAACLSNMRNLETAHWAYLTESHGVMLGTRHGQVSWMDVLRRYNPALLLRSPVDTSPHFTGGTPINGRYRESSYALNMWLAPEYANSVKKIEHVRRPGATAHYALLVFEGPKAASDHIHPFLWTGADSAATEVQINAHGGEPATPDAVSAYGFLDGHAEALPFKAVFTDQAENRFDPTLAR